MRIFNWFSKGEAQKKLEKDLMVANARADLAEQTNKMFVEYLLESKRKMDMLSSNSSDIIAGLLLQLGGETVISAEHVKMIVGMQNILFDTHKNEDGSVYLKLVVDDEAEFEEDCDCEGDCE